MPGNRYELAGETFGQWTVISRAFTMPKRGWYWLCRCSCSALHTISGSALRRKTTTQCRACAYARNHEDLTGQKFEDWRVLSSAGRDSRGRFIWNCRCSCGKVKVVKGYNLMGGRSHRCASCAQRLRHAPEDQ